MGCRVILGVVVSKVDFSRCPIDMELVLLGPIADPVETHINGLGPLLFYGSIDDAISCGIVGAKRRGWLLVSEFDQCCAEGHGLLSIVKERRYLCFGSECDDHS
jgi:hypothetical protein